MLCITLESDDPFFNLAIEELLLKNRKEEYLILGINSPSVIIGKHQSPHKEVNTKFITENNIPVLRRISGGGTVYHDKGNLNFTFIRCTEAGKQIDFRKYTLPVIEFLSYFGVDARFEGKNDIRINGLKISGNAEHVHRNRVLHHGTLLFSTSPEMLRNSIRKDTSCYSTRGVASNPSSVTNLENYLPAFKNISKFRSEFMNYFLLNMSETKRYSLTEQEIKEAQLIADSKYRSWEWNWAYGPEYAFQNTIQINGKNHNCNLFVKEGIISKCSIEGSESMSVISEKLIGRRHMVKDLQDFFDEQNVLLTDGEIFNFF